MMTRRLQADIEAIGNDRSLYSETSFAARADAIDRLDFCLLECSGAAPLAGAAALAEQVKAGLQAVDAALFRRLRADIRSGACRGAALQQLMRTYAGDSDRNAVGYDAADAFVNGLLLCGDVPAETREREPEMVAYQPAPARVILEMLSQGTIGRSDVFYDIGSGLGRVPLLASLLSGCVARGVEMEPAFCAYARRCAQELNVSGVEFILADARDVDYRDGTVFFMYTPFRGNMLREALAQLQRGARGRQIKLYTYGPCSVEIERCTWLKRIDRNGENSERLAFFTHDG